MYHVIYEIPKGTMQGQTIVVSKETFEEAKEHVVGAAAQVGVIAAIMALKGDYFAHSAARRIRDNIDQFKLLANSTPCSLDLGDGNIYTISDKLPNHDYMLYVKVNDSTRLSEETPGYTGPVDRD